MTKIFGGVLLSLGLVSQVAWAGFEAGNGTDNEKFGGTSWFLNQNRSVSYCYDESATFFVSKDDVEKGLADAFEQWRAYVDAKKINARRVAAGNSKLTLATTFVLKPRCDGSEDLKFYLGSDNARVKDYRKNYESPVAFAGQTAYDPVQGWGKGFVWLAPAGSIDPVQQFPNWHLSLATFNAVILHEVGHVLGCGHVSGTIMDENLSALLQHLIAAPFSFLKIDSTRELAVCADCEVVTSGSVGGSESFTASARQTFSYFTGKPAGVGPLTGTLTLSADLTSATLVLADLQNHFPFRIALQATVLDAPIRSGYSEVFRSAIMDPLQRIYRESEKGYAGVYFGSTTLATGQTVHLVLTRNADSVSRARIDYFDSNHQALPLFVGQE